VLCKLASTQVVFSVCNEGPDVCAQPDLPPPDEHPPGNPLPPIDPPAGATLYKLTDPLPDQNAVLKAPYDCSIWRGGRTYLEAQNWFTRPGLDANSGASQLQVGACLPHKQMVAGVIPVDVMLGKYYFPRWVSAEDEPGVHRFGGHATHRLATESTTASMALEGDLLLLSCVLF
jgi:hypothetical protein